MALFYQRIAQIEKFRRQRDSRMAAHYLPTGGIRSNVGWRWLNILLVGVWKFNNLVYRWCSILHLKKIILFVINLVVKFYSFVTHVRNKKTPFSFPLQRGMSQKVSESTSINRDGHWLIYYLSNLNWSIVSSDGQHLRLVCEVKRLHNSSNSVTKSLSRALYTNLPTRAATICTV